MTITPSSLLSLPVITTGTESGLWGDYVNNGLTQYLDIAIAGQLPITITTADVTLTKTSGTNAATGIVSTTAQYAILNISGAKTAARNLYLPNTSKWYIINNAGTSTGGPFTLTVRGVTGPTTGVTLVDGEECIVAWNGSDFAKVASTVLTALTGTLSAANGGTGAATLTANNVVLGNGTSAVQFVAPSTSGNVLTSNGTTWTSAAGYAGVAATVFTANGTFTIPTGITRIKMTIVGGGGGGGSGTGGCCGKPGSGGGGGGAAIKWLTGLTPGNTLAVTVGAAGAINGGTGGTSSVASGTQSITTVSATGGSGGANNAIGGAGGLGSSGDLNIGGNAGNSSGSVSTISFAGGGSIFGGGGAGSAVGRAYGGGGGGGAGASGAAGATGAVFIEY